MKLKSNEVKWGEQETKADSENTEWISRSLKTDKWYPEKKCDISPCLMCGDRWYLKTIYVMQFLKSKAYISLLCDIHSMVSATKSMVVILSDV